MISSKITLLLYLIIIIQTSLQSPLFRSHHKKRSSISTLFYYLNNDIHLNIIDKHNHYRPESDIILNDEKSVYTLLYNNDKGLLIGSPQNFYNLSSGGHLNRLEVVQNKQTDEEAEGNNIFFYSECTQMQFSCFNQIRAAFTLFDDTILVICGQTKKPVDAAEWQQPQQFCRKYSIISQNDQDSTHYRLIDEFDIPQQLILTNNNKGTLFSNQDDIYFVNSGSFTQESSINKLILSPSINNNNNNVTIDFTISQMVKTPMGALKNPMFQSSFGFGDKLYFFYWETESVEDSTNNNNEPNLWFKRSYSLIGQVCSDDTGRSSIAEPGLNRFLTFQKTRIYCYLPDYQNGFHVKYEEIQSVTKPFKSKQFGGMEVFYAIFRIRRTNLVVDSAVCMFKLSTIQSTMSQSNFKIAKTKNSQSQQLNTIKYKKPLAHCSQYKQMNVANEYYKEMSAFYKYELDQVLSARALFVKSSTQFTAITVDSRSSVDIVYLGLEDGRVLRLSTRTRYRSYLEPIVLNVYSSMSQQPVSSLTILAKSNRLISVSSDKVISIDLSANCDKYHSCRLCVHSQDSNCGWSSSEEKCLFKIGEMKSKNWLQDIHNGNYSICPFNDEEPFYSISNEEEEDPFYSESLKAEEETKNSVTMAVMMTAILSCVFSVLITWLLIVKGKKVKALIWTKSGTSSGNNLSAGTTTANTTDQSSRASTTSSTSSKYKSLFEKTKKKENFYIQQSSLMAQNLNKLKTVVLNSCKLNNSSTATVPPQIVVEETKDKRINGEEEEIIIMNSSHDEADTCNTSQTSSSCFNNSTPKSNSIIVDKNKRMNKEDEVKKEDTLSSNSSTSTSTEERLAAAMFEPNAVISRLLRHFNQKLSRNNESISSQSNNQTPQHHLKVESNTNDLTTTSLLVKINKDLNT